MPARPIAAINRYTRRRIMRAPSVVERAALPFQTAVPNFGVEPPRLRGARRLRLAPHFRHYERAAHELGQPLERGGLVLLLAAKLLRLDDDDAVGRDAVIAQREEALARGRRQRARARGVEAQLHGARDLVDVLAARALRTDRREVELRLGDRHAAVHAKPVVDSQAVTPSIRGPQFVGLNSWASIRGPQFAGSMRRIAPASSSVSRYSSSSGPCRTSRMRWRKSTSSISRRSSSQLSLKRMRSRCPVPGISPMRMPPTNALPFQLASLSPV